MDKDELGATKLSLALNHKPFNLAFNRYLKTAGDRYQGCKNEDTDLKVEVQKPKA